MSKCKFEGCTKYASFGYESDNKCIRCSSHKEPDMINIKLKNRKNKYPCGKVPIYGYKNEKAKFCGKCKDPNDTNIRNIFTKICQSCGKNGHYTIPGSNIFFCIDHKQDDMINFKKKHLLSKEKFVCICGSKFNEQKYKINESDEQYSCYLCHLKSKPKKGYCHCSKRATFGLTEATRCKKHIEEGMIDLKNINKKNKVKDEILSDTNEKLCSICVTSFTSTINPKSKTNELYKTCEECRNTALQHRCQHGRQPSRCKDCKGVSFCIHGKVKIACRECEGSQICEHKRQRYLCKDCKGAAFCEHGKRKYNCIECEGSQICEHKKQQRYCRDCEGTAFCEHGKRKSACRDCGGVSICHHNINRSSCKECMGSQICIHKIRKQRCFECDGRDLCNNKEGLCTQQGNRKYKGYCTFCYSHLFPDDPLTATIRRKTKELQIRDFINENYEEFVHDKPITIGDGCNCTNRRRIDFRKIIGNTMLAIEVDEFQHRRYDQKDETARYNDMTMIFTGKWYYIRYNPDTYKDKSGKLKNPDMKTRLTKLQDVMDAAIYNILNDKNEELLLIEYVYFDE